MNAQQIQKEIEKYQAEMAAIQLKYAADPTPENIAKMQQEMVILSQKMTELSMQYAVSGNFDISDFLEDDDDDDYDDDDDAGIRQFILDNPVPPDKEKYMLIGALLLSTHGEIWQTLASMEVDDYWLEVLKQGWGISEIKEGKKMLESLLEGRHTIVYGEDFLKFKAGQPHKLDSDSIEAYNATLECLDEDFPTFLSYAEKCDNILAWDLERVGYLARIFHHVGWMDETETFDWLKKAADKIKAAYSSWEKYIAAILVGRAIAYAFDDLMIAVAEDILVNGKEFLDAHPIKKL
ncbi:MAG: DUF1266 domain-containing protein [Methanimicrococcus sp.]|nr:DUF1266 domain-containing protein [Methanimicrococcus sp.]